MIAVPENDPNGLTKGEDILTFDVSDDSLERAAAVANGKAITVGYCTHWYNCNWPCNTVAPPISRQTACEKTRRAGLLRTSRSCRTFCFAKKQQAHRVLRLSGPLVVNAWAGLLLFCGFATSTPRLTPLMATTSSRVTPLMATSASRMT